MLVSLDHCFPSFTAETDGSAKCVVLASSVALASSWRRPWVVLASSWPRLASFWRRLASSGVVLASSGVVWRRPGIVWRRLVSSWRRLAEQEEKKVSSSIYTNSRSNANAAVML